MTLNCARGFHSIRFRHFVVKLSSSMGISGEIEDATITAEKTRLKLRFQNSRKEDYYVTKPVLGKSERSDWFFLGRDFAVRTVSMETVQAVYFCFGAKPANS